MNLLRPLLCGAVVVSVACTASLSIPDDLQVRCGSSAECPSGRVCANVGYCVDVNQSCVSASGGVYIAANDGATCALAGATGICVGGSCRASTCGDGYADAVNGEGCDSGLANSDTTPDSCRSDCQPAHCGDTVVDVARGEACDDGNTQGADGCAADCAKVERCGDGVLDAGEDCDDGNANENDSCDGCHRTTWVADVLVGYGLGGGNPTTTPVDGPNSVMFDENGALFIGGYARVQRLDASTQRLTVIAGNGVLENGFTPGLATQTRISIIRGMTRDNQGNLFLIDDPWAILMVDTKGFISAFAGTPGSTCFDTTTTQCKDGGLATSAIINASAIAVDGFGDLYIADHARIRKITRVATGQNIIDNYIGSKTALCTPTTAACGDGQGASAATFASTSGLAFDPAGNLYIADAVAHRIRKVANDANRTMSTIAGTGVACSTRDCSDGSASATLGSVSSLALDAAGNVYFADSRNGTSAYYIRRVDTHGVVTAVADGGQCAYGAACGDGGPLAAAQFSIITGIDVAPDGTLAVADDFNNRVRRTNTAGVINTVAGSGSEDPLSSGTAATSAQIGGISAAWDAAGNLLVLDASGGASPVLYSVAPARPVLRPLAGIVPPMAVTGTDNVPATQAAFSIADVVVDSHNNIFVMDTDEFSVRRIDAATGVVNRIVGDGDAETCADPTGTCGDGSNARLAQLGGQATLAIDGNDDLLIADSSNHKIRKVTLSACTGFQCPISTVAGTGTASYSGDGAAATAATLACPSAVTATADGTVYITDMVNCRVRAIAANGTINTVVDKSAACDTTLENGCTSDAILGGPWLDSITHDENQQVYFVDASAGAVERLESSGGPTIVLGTGNPPATCGYSCGQGDGLSGVNVSFYAVQHVFADGHGHIGVTDLGSPYLADRVRVADLASFTIRTAAGDVDGLPQGPLGSSIATNPQGLTPLPTGIGWFVADGVGGRLLRLDVTNDWLDVVAGYPLIVPSVTTGPARYSPLFENAAGVAYDPLHKVVYIAEAGAATIRAVTMSDSADSTTWQSSVLVSGAPLAHPTGLAFDAAARLLYIADSDANVIRSVTVDSGPTLGIIAGGAGRRGFSGDGGAATDAALQDPEGVAVAADGAVFIADTGNNRVRAVAGGIIDTVIGVGIADSSGNGSPATAFPVDAPKSAAFDSFGNLFITSHDAVRMIVAHSGSPSPSLSQSEVRTIYGAYPRTAFPDATTSCLTGVSVSADDASVAVTDACQGYVVRLSRTRQ